jgi:hypothetical protein
MMVESSILTILLFGWLFARTAREAEERQELLDLARGGGSSSASSGRRGPSPRAAGRSCAGASRERRSAQPLAPRVVRSPMPRFATPIVLLCALLALGLPGAASASRTQTMTFEAPRDLLNPSLRPSALNEIGGFGVSSLRLVLYWHNVAPNPTRACGPTSTSRTRPPTTGASTTRS